MKTEEVEGKIKVTMTLPILEKNLYILEKECNLKENKKHKIKIMMMPMMMMMVVLLIEVKYLHILEIK